MRWRMSPLSFGTAPLPGRECSGGATCRWGAGCEGFVGTPISSATSGLPAGKALVGVERPRVDELALVGLPAQLLHRPGKHEPVQHFLLARRLDGGERRLAPGLVVARAKRLVEATVGLDVRVELVVLVGEEGVG